MKILFAPYAAKCPSLNGARNPKDYPWAKELVDLLESRGNEVIQVGVEGEKQVAGRFEKNLPFKEVTKLLMGCDTFIAVDSYLQHHAWLVEKPGIVVWGISDPEIFGHLTHKNLLKSRDTLRQNQFDLYYSNQHNDEAFPKPEEVASQL